MLPDELHPTPLIDRSERAPLQKGEPPKPSPYRTLYVLYHLVRTLMGISWLWLTRRLTRQELAHRIRGFLQKMGTLWIKTGQILAQRSDLLSTEFCVELSKIRDQGVAFPFDIAKRIVEEDLGAPLEKYFDEFDETPFAATTISQTHRARLRQEQIWVAVKVQQPHARWVFSRDMALIRSVVRILEFFSFHSFMRWRDLCHELNETMLRELDFHYEASSFEKLKKTLEKHEVYVPELFRRYSTRRVLVTEFIRAALMSDFILLSRTDPARLERWLEENNIDPLKVGKRMFDSVFRQIFEDNLFHGDMHPRNIILLRDSKIAVIDCRTVGSLEMETREKHRLYLRDLSNREYSAAADIYFLLASKLPVVDISEVKRRVVRLWKNWETRNHISQLPYSQKSITNMFDELNEIVFRYRFAAQWPMSRLVQSLKNLDYSLSSLCGDLNFLKWLREYFLRADRRAARTPMDWKKSADLLMRSRVAAGELPKRISEFALFQQTVVRRQAVVFSAPASKIAYVLASMYAMVYLALTLSGAFLVFTFLYQHHEFEVRPWLGNQLFSLVEKMPRMDYWPWVAVLLILVYFHRSVARLNKQLIEKEVEVSEPSPTV